MPDANKTTSYIKHIFTGNLPHLQSYTEEWLRNVQLELDFVRKPGDNGMATIFLHCNPAADSFQYIGPYFGYSANFRNIKSRDPRTMKWPEIPDCIVNMKDCMVSRTKLYAQEGDIRIDQLDILAWVTSGGKKARILYPPSVLF